MKARYFSVFFATLFLGGYIGDAVLGPSTLPLVLIGSVWLGAVLAQKASDEGWFEATSPPAAESSTSRSRVADEASTAAATDAEGESLAAALRGLPSVDAPPVLDEYRLPGGGLREDFSPEERVLDHIVNHLPGLRRRYKETFEYDLAKAVEDPGKRELIGRVTIAELESGKVLPVQRLLEHGQFLLSQLEAKAFWAEKHPSERMERELRETSRKNTIIQEFLIELIDTSPRVHEFVQANGQFALHRAYLEQVVRPRMRS